MKRTKVFFSLLFLLLTAVAVRAQDKIEILPGVGSLERGEKNGVEYWRLLQNVQLKQKETFLYCDSAHFYREQNYVDIFSNVRVVQNTLTITSSTATYNGNQQVATFKGGVNLRDENLNLTTPSLIYNMATRTGRYTEGGTIVETENTLTSRSGNYNLDTKLLSFKGNVHVVGKDADIQSDTLQYNTVNKTVYFVAPTRIKNEQGNLTARGGYYNTLTKESLFLNSQVETADYTISGQKLLYDRVKQYLHATGNVKMVSKDQKNKVIITGQEARHWEGLGRSKISGSPVMRSLVSGDTLFISADTLISVDNKDPKLKDFLYAYYGVRIFKSDLQGKCDSLSYNLTDSLMMMNYDPILWSNNSQLVSDKMHMQMKNRTIDRMYMYSNAFIVSEDSLKNLNQIKGRDMTAFFETGNIRRVDVNGNGESIYFALEGDTVLTGMNKTVCSDMVLKFKDKKLQTISFLTNPDASFIPPHELKEPDKRLKGFKWRIDEKPTKKLVLAKRTKKPVRPVKPAVVADESQPAGKAARAPKPVDGNNKRSKAKAKTPPAKADFRTLNNK
jgi:lipopolysaccharide export system protein LptA